MHFHRHVALSLTLVAPARDRRPRLHQPRQRCVSNAGCMMGNCRSCKSENILMMARYNRGANLKKDQRSSRRINRRCLGELCTRLQGLYQHQVNHAVAPSTGTLTVLRKALFFCFFSICVFLFPCLGNYTQGHADVSFNPFHLNNMCCCDSVHYLRQYAAAVMTTKRAQLPVVYHNYRRQSEHLSNHNE